MNIPCFGIIVALDPKGRATVKRDMELVRKILLAVQAREDTRGEPVTIDGYEPHIVARHVEMLVDAGMLQGYQPPVGRSHAGKMAITDMSWAGHDFLAAMENKGVWAKLKGSFSAAELAGMPLDVMKDVGVGLLKEWAKSRVGLSG